MAEVTQGRSEESSECLLDPFCFEEEKRKFEGVIHHLLETHPWMQKPTWRCLVLDALGYLADLHGTNIHDVQICTLLVLPLCLGSNPTITTKWTWKWSLLSFRRWFSTVLLPSWRSGHWGPNQECKIKTTVSLSLSIFRRCFSKLDTAVLGISEGTPGNWWTLWAG